MGKIIVRERPGRNGRRDLKNDENETGCTLATMVIVEPEAFMRGVFLRKGRKSGG